MSTGTKLLAGLVLLGSGIGIGLGLDWWLNRSATPGDAADASATAAGDVLYWYDPMRPEVHFDKPGRSPFMDMALVPKHRSATAEGGVAINPRMSQNLGVRTTPVMAVPVTPRVTVTGTIAIDERRLAVVTTRTAGWVERLDVRAAGDVVKRGHHLAGLYSPDLLAAQEEYLLSIRTDDQVLIPAARRRLELLGVTSGQLDRIARRGVPDRKIDIVAPMDGVVTELLVREGASVGAGMPIVNLADLSRVWLIAAVPETQGAWLKAGQAAEITLASVGSTPVSGRVDYLYPELSAETRTTRARILVKNETLALRPGMSARVTIEGEPRTALVVPTEALIRSGERTAVILAEGEGRFRPVAVVPGAEQGEQTEIRSGLEAGDSVVTSGQFLIDSEANLRGALERLLPGEKP